MFLEQIPQKIMQGTFQKQKDGTVVLRIIIADDQVDRELVYKAINVSKLSFCVFQNFSYTYLFSMVRLVFAMRITINLAY